MDLPDPQHHDRAQLGRLCCRACLCCLRDALHELPSPLTGSLPKRVCGTAQVHRRGAAALVRLVHARYLSAPPVAKGAWSNCDATRSRIRVRNSVE